MSDIIIYASPLCKRVEEFPDANGVTWLHSLLMAVVTDQCLRKHHPICCRSVAPSETLNLANPHNTGLISTYELSGKQHPELIERAKDLGNKLSVAWSAQVGRTSFLHVERRTGFVL